MPTINQLVRKGRKRLFTNPTHPHSRVVLKRGGSVLQLVPVHQKAQLCP